MGIRSKVVQTSRFVDPAKARTLALRALLFDEWTTDAKTIVASQSPYTLNTTTDPDLVLLADATAGNIVVNLPNANLTAGRHFLIKKVDVTVNTVTITPSGGALIDGAASYILTGIGMPSVHLVSDGTNWFLWTGAGTSGSSPFVLVEYNEITRPPANAAHKNWMIAFRPTTGGPTRFQVCLQGATPANFSWVSGPTGGF